MVPVSMYNDLGENNEEMYVKKGAALFNVF
jgi:hypothetical protein